MKIQHKRSEQLEEGLAKEPSSEFMEYGELAVNFNGVDPVIFLKDSDDNIVRIAGSNSRGINDGAININAGTGLIATGSNATANQSLNTTRQLSINEEWLDQKIIDVSPDVNNGKINISAGTGLTANRK